MFGNFIIEIDLSLCTLRGLKYLSDNEAFLMKVHFKNSKKRGIEEGGGGVCQCLSLLKVFLEPKNNSNIVLCPSKFWPWKFNIVNSMFITSFLISSLDCHLRKERLLSRL